MSMSYAAVTLLMASVFSQPGAIPAPEELQGTWVGMTFPIAIRLEGTKAKVFLPSSKSLDAPIEIEVTRVARGLPNSTIEFTATATKALEAFPAVAGPSEIHGLFRIFGDEAALLLQPKGTALPEHVDLTEAPIGETSAIRFNFKKIPADQAAEFERVHGVWRLDLKFDQYLIVIGPGFVVVERRADPAHRALRVILDPEKRQAMWRNYIPTSDESEEHTLGYSYDVKDRLTLIWHESKSPLTLVRATPEDLLPPPDPKEEALEGSLPPPDPKNEALDSLAGSWTAVRGWARRRNKDVPRREVDERWVFAGDKLSVEADGEKTEYVVWTMLESDAALIGLTAPRNAEKIVRFGRFEVTDDMLRIRLHPSIAPDEPPTPVEKSASDLRTLLYEFRRTPAP